MPISSEAVNRSTNVDPAKLLEKVRRWCPGDPIEVPITLVKSFIEAAASGCNGQQRLGVLEEYVLGLEGQLCSNAQKKNKIKKQTDAMLNDKWHVPELRPGDSAPLAKAVLAAVERAPDQVLDAKQIHTSLQREETQRDRRATDALLKRMSDCGLLERVEAGVYGLPGRPR